MDVLNDILDTLDLKGTLYFRTDFSGPWSVTVPDLENAARFHLVIQGQCHITLSTGVNVTLYPGDLILIPKGRSHILADGPGHPDAPPLETVLDQVGYDGRGVLVVGEGDENASTQMVCGHFNFRNGADHPLLRALPDYMLTTSIIRAKHAVLDEMLRLVTRKIFSDDIGTPSTITRLSEIIFIELLRIGVAQSPELSRIIQALQDPQIGRAIELIHNAPSESWSVESLAREVGMSRSRFAERFRNLLNTGPMTYLSDWRLQKSLTLLDQPHINIQQVATDTGYQSPAAFSRAFSGKFGYAPREYRRISA